MVVVATRRDGDRAIRDIEKQVAGIDEVEKWTTTIKSNSERILKRTSLMRTALHSNISTLDVSMARLRALDD